MPGLWRILLLLLILLLVGLDVWIIALVRKNSGKSSLQTTPSLIERAYATVLDKKIDKRTTETHPTPGHYLEYRILFALADGRERWVAVPKEIYEDFNLQEQGELLTQGDLFLDFVNKYGE